MQTPNKQSLPAVHALLMSHLGQVVDPPQSVSLSPPFFTTSVQVAALQVPDVQTALVQSLANMQVLFVAHLGQVVDPPQSVSLSPRFLTVSMHVGALHVSGGPVQTRLWQSVETAHVLFAMQAPHAPPPQSTSVSVPFFTRSAQPAFWQTLVVQTPFKQSVPAPHTLPAAHRRHVVGPPQSASVSPPFFTVSEHDGAWQVTLQTLLWQSLAPVQVLPLAHLVVQVPPQSMSLSVPFLTRSPHAGARQVPAGQTPLWQSPGTLHVLPATHLPHVAPPQSMAVSVPFLTRSEQLGVWQMFEMHTPL